MSMTRRAALARPTAFAARPNWRRIAHMYAADRAREALFALAEAAGRDRFSALRGEA
jgi:hypothetical protein